MTNLRERLQGIRTFPSLVKFLREELDWPIDSAADFEDLTFEYTPDELGIDPVNAAKIDEIKRLRPLVPSQPWGIFFVKFEPKQLPVVALRRILNRVVVKKRATPSAAEQKQWATDDLLFISSYGDDAERRISFAHFSRDSATSDLPTLRVLAWDDKDTGLHLDDVAKRLAMHLAWPTVAAESDYVTWRDRWSVAFELRQGEVVTTSRALAIRLAELARAIRIRIRGVLDIESRDGPVTGLMTAFRAALVHDLEPDDFADMYAQTIAYGLLSARVANPDATGSAEHLPVTNPFLKELMETFLQPIASGALGGRAIDFDELGVSEVVRLLDDANMEAVVRDFGDRNPEDDPVIHFYELFLKEYDAKKRMQRGVFYTPRPVVSSIVRQVDHVLRTEFGLQDGLADTATWRAQAKRNSALRIPNGIEPGDPFVQILDPAAGTGTFLVEVIDVIHRTLDTKWSSQGHAAPERLALWNDYVPTHLLPRLYGYELLMAPYAIAHLKIGLKLFETGYRFGKRERTRIYLTNALEPATVSRQLELDVPALAHEAQAVNRIKRDKRFTVVMGNPPYSKLSANLSDEARASVDVYRYIDGERIRERGALQFEMNLQDDYVKFMRLSEEAVARSGAGAIGVITNSGYLVNPTLRGMRASLCGTFARIDILDLRGQHHTRSRPGDIHDENVFDIQQGVAIAVLRTRAEPAGRAHVSYASLNGSRASKYAILGAAKFAELPLQPVEATPPLYKFLPSDGGLREEFETMMPLPELFPRNSAGFITSRDGLVVDGDRGELRKRIAAFGRDERSESDIYEANAFRHSRRLKLRDAQAAVRRDGDPSRYLRPCLYRPFDSRWVYYNRVLIESYKPIANDMSLEGNLGLLATRQVTGREFEHAFISGAMIEIKACSHDRNTQIFPLYLAGDEADASALFAESRRRPNIAQQAVTAITGATGLVFDAGGMTGTFSAEDVLHYVYAVLHSLQYRTRYVELLRSEFPRMPLAPTRELFCGLVGLGTDLARFHLLEHSELPTTASRYEGPPEPVVGRVAWTDDTVLLDSSPRKAGKPDVAPGGAFTGVHEEVWNFHIGGYQVCHKWLKDRRGRMLATSDLVHYQRILIAIAQTVRLMAAIDELITGCGGWPAAFEGPDGNGRRVANQQGGAREASVG